MRPYLSYTFVDRRLISVYVSISSKVFKDDWARFYKSLDLLKDKYGKPEVYPAGCRFPIKVPEGGGSSGRTSGTGNALR